MTITAEAMLAHLATRRSVRVFTDAPVARAVIERVLAAAMSAPSATNRQPWRFTVVTATAVRDRIVAAVRARTEALDRAIQPGRHAAEWGAYGDFFWQPLVTAPVIIVPAVREYPDALATFLRSAGADPGRFELPSVMHSERCALGGAVFALMLQAHAEGLGSAWMAGPMVARSEIEALCAITVPWQIAGAIALGTPAVVPSAPVRRPPEQIVRWIEEEPA